MKDERVPTQGFESLACNGCSWTLEPGWTKDAAAHMAHTGCLVVSSRTLIGPAVGFEAAWTERHGR